MGPSAPWPPGVGGGRMAGTGPCPYQAVQVIVVPHEGVEGPQLGPAHTQLLRGVAQEATDVRPDQGHPQQVELQDFWGERGGWPQAAGAAQVQILPSSLYLRVRPMPLPGASSLSCGLLPDIRVSRANQTRLGRAVSPERYT